MYMQMQDSYIHILKKTERKTIPSNMKVNTVTKKRKSELSIKDETNKLATDTVI